MMRTRLTACLMLLLLLLSPAPPAKAAQSAPGDITAQCAIKLPVGKESRKKILDRNYKSGWRVYRARTAEITISLPKGQKANGLYLCFGSEPAEITLYQGDDDQPIFHEEINGIPHKYLPVTGQGQLRLLLKGGAQGFLLSELFVVAGDEPPPWVQRWQPPLKKADLLVLVAHPDDELLWMGGTLPWYAAQRGLDVAVAYMTCANYLRRHEMLNGLWTAGVRHYPYIGSFRDRRFSTMKEALAYWGGQDKADAFVTSLIRQLRPEVMLSHDLKGEYGHLAHIITANAVMHATQRSDQADFFPDSAQLHGLWRPSKLYLHLYKENTLSLDWQKPVTALGSQSALAIAQQAFMQHTSQRGKWTIPTDGPHSASEFGLVYSLVGQDISRDDFFENISVKSLLADSDSTN